nr:pirin family protein [Alistipes onderdonkii]
MEIVSIALEGALRHGDSMGNMQELRPGEIQVLSAGTGITHSENERQRHGAREIPADMGADRCGEPYAALQPDPAGAGKAPTN